MMTKIAIIGAGLSGLVLARELGSVAEVTLFEKARGVSGRISTRYADPYQFDHGAQFFTAKTNAFKQFLQPLIKEGIIARWDARFVELNGDQVMTKRQWGEGHPHYVGMPKMNQIAKHLSEGLNIELPVRIAAIEKKGEQWSLCDEAGEWRGDFDWVISTAPAEQTAVLMPSDFAHLDVIKQTKMSGCFALMLGFAEPLPLEWDAALVRNADISWISVNSSKPERPEGFALLINSTNVWAEEHLDNDRDEVRDYLCKEVSRVIGYDVSQAEHIGLHGWRYANIAKQKETASLVDMKQQLAACGDWCIQGRVESAFTSAMDCAAKLKAALG